MNENDFGQKIARTLDTGLDQIDEPRLAKLRAARQRALSAYREPVQILGLVTVSGQALNFVSWARKPLFWLPAVAIAAAVIALVWPADESYDDIGELDARLLTGELPIDAFLDKDFGAWVKDSSQ